MNNPVKVIAQYEVDEMFESHANYVRGVRGGKRMVLHFRDASRVDFSGKELTSADFVGSKLNYADFSHAALVGSSFFAADMQGADFRRADLTKADLRGVNLRNANLEAANLTNADIRDGVLLRPDEDGNLIAVLKRATSIDNAKMAGANLTSAKLGKVVGRNTDLSNCNFSNAKLEWRGSVRLEPVGLPLHRRRPHRLQPLALHSAWFGAGGCGAERNQFRRRRSDGGLFPPD